MAQQPKKASPYLLDEDQCPRVLSYAARKARAKWANKDEADKILKAHGSPGFRPTRAQANQVESMAAMGLRPSEIGTILGIEKHLIEFFYEYEVKTGASRANLAVGKVALEMALDKQHGEMTKFWLQSRAGWAPKTQIDHTGVDKDADDARAAREKLLEPEPGDDVAGGEV